MGYIRHDDREGKPLVEDCLTLDLAWLMRLAPIRCGERGSGGVEWSSEGVPIGRLRFCLDLANREAARLTLNFYALGSDGQREPVEQVIFLTAIPQHFGGLRWWFRCPLTGRKSRTLHLPPGETLFASRVAWDLAYRVERLNRFDRPFEKLFREQRRLRGPEGLATGLARPKGMWKRTYARHVDRFRDAEIECLDGIASLIDRR